MKNPDFLFRNPDFLLRNVEFVIKHTALATQLKTDGYVLLPGCLSEGRLKLLTELMDESAHLAGAGEEYLLESLFNCTPEWLPLLDIPRVLRVAEIALMEGIGHRGGDAPAVSDCHLIKMDGAKGLNPNRRLDRGLYCDYVPVVVPQELLEAGTVPPMPLKMLSAHFVLEDCDLGSGALGVVPGSHASGRAPQAADTAWGGAQAQAVAAKGGDVMLVRCDTWRIDTPREVGAPAGYTLRVDYGERNIAQRFLAGPGALEFEYDPSVVAACNETQKRLIGKRAHGAYD